MKRSLGLFLGLSVLSLTPAESPAAPNDFDGDGKSDVVTASTTRSPGRTRWHVKQGLGAVVRPRQNALGDALVPGDYDGDGKTDPAVVFVRNSDLPLEWHIRKSSGGSEMRAFGEPGDQPVPGDYDCDGKADLAVARPNGSNVRWLFSLSSGQSQTPFNFGTVDDKIFSADRDGDECSELFALSLDGNEIEWTSRKLAGSSTESVKWGMPGDIPLAPLDLNDDNTPDYIVARRSGRQHVAIIRTGANSSLTVPIGSVKSIPFTTNALGQNWFGVLNRLNETVRLFARNGTSQTIKFKGPGSIFVRPDGSVVQPGQNERFAASEFGLCEQKSFSGGALWKPVSDGANKGKPTILLPTSLNSHNVDGVKLYKKNGTFLYNTSLRYWNGNEGRATFDVPKTGSELKADAPLKVRVFLKNGSCQDRPVPDPTQRYD